MKKKTRYALLGSCAVLLIAVVVCSIALYSMYAKAASEDPTVWEGDIRDFENEVSTPGGILFVGSSSIRFWKTLGRDMHPLPVTNRGFGGSRLPALIHYADRIVYPHRPVAVVIYCGDNDMSVGRRRTPEEVLNDVVKLTGDIRAKLPEARIYYVSIKPSPSRMDCWPAMKKANMLVAEYMEGLPGMSFIDVSNAMFEPSGELKRGIFTWDRIHMNERGYALWTSIIRPVLVRDFESMMRK